MLCIKVFAHQSQTDSISCAEDGAMPGMWAKSTSCRCASVNKSMSQRVFELHPL